MLIKLVRYTIKKLVREHKGYKLYLNDLKTFRDEHAKLGRTDIIGRFPCVSDKTAATPFDTHYVYHPAWAMRIVKKISPAFHIDISSSLHFAAGLSAFIPVKFYDYRPANLLLSNLETGTADLCKLDFEDNSIGSLSCMHTIEHIGLGRYGDPLDVDGDKKAVSELQRVTKNGGTLLFVTPVGKPRIMFNAHRIYSYEQVIQLFDKMDLIEFSMVPDNGLKAGLILHADTSTVSNQDYACGCFWFKKKESEHLHQNI